MSAQEVKDFFDRYVFGFMCLDIKREIAVAKSGVVVHHGDGSYCGGGNFLCALGLLCYTEFMGGIKLGSFSSPSRQLFEAFFHAMGPDYKALDAQLSEQPSIRNPTKKLSAYEVYRCGMVHEYFIKQNGVIFMLKGAVKLGIEDEPTLYIGPSNLRGPYECGVGILDDDGRYFFIVEKYYEDFAAACRNLYDEIMSTPNPSIPNN